MEPESISPLELRSEHSHRCIRSSMSVPKTMKAYTVRRNLLWPFHVLLSSAYANQPEFVDRPVPTPADDELLVKVETFAAVSLWDQRV